ncbi:FliG C-terminal domain-containing protein [Bythopirellula polymerisocia]|nr:FliG C-terminal domain-containing protein [Bythopirellula polymerisocia]
MIDTIRDNPLRKVAILIACLDEEWSERVLSSLPADQAEIVRQRVEQLAEIDPEEQREILREFRRNFSQSMMPSSEGVELDLTLQERIQRDNYSPPTESPRRPLETLSEADTEFIVEMLVDEHPQTIALVLSRLDTERAVEVLGKFSPSIQADIMQRLAELDTIDDESVQVVESQVARWISEQRERKARMSAGMDMVERIMSKTPPAQRNKILAEFNKNNSVFALKLAREAVHPSPQKTAIQTPERKLSPPLVQSAPRIVPPQPAKAPAPPKNPFASYTTEQCAAGLESLDSGTLLSALSQCEAQVVRLALVGASEKLLKRVLAGQSRREAKLFRQSLREIGPIRISDIVSAQQELLHTASKMKSF